MNKDFSTDLWDNIHKNNLDLYHIDTFKKALFDNHSRDRAMKAIRAKAKEYNRPLRILDLGCGVGLDSVYLALEGHNVTALDYSEHMLTETRRMIKAANILYNRNLNIKVIQGDLLNLDLGGKFDVILSVNVINIWKERTVRDKIYQNIIGLLEPNGCFVLVAINSLNPLWKIAFKNDAWHVADYNASILRSELIANGFEIIKIKSIGLSDMFGQWVDGKWKRKAFEVANYLFYWTPDLIRMPFAPHIMAVVTID